MDQDFSNVSDYQTLLPQWRGRTLKMFVAALKRYLVLLLPYRSPNNTKILEEIRLVKRLIQHIVSCLRRCQDDLDITELPLEAINYKLLSDIVHKYWAIKESNLKDIRNKVLVEGALEGEEKEVEAIREVLQNPLFQTIQRRRVLVLDFSTPTNIQSSKKEETKVQQQISIGNLYGQVVFGDNFGQLYQSNNAELLATLQKLFKIVSESKDLTPELKGNAIGDIQTIQAQAMKAKPNKSIMDKARESLSILADVSQVGTAFGALLSPHLDKIGKLLSQINIP